jgi:ABC-type transport system involved in multi-copper enzyme maturation permease subunit
VIARFLALPLLELRSVHRRPLHVVMFALFGLMSLGFVLGAVQVSTGSADTGGAKLAINSAFNLAFADFAQFGLILPFFVAVLFGMPPLTDTDRRVDRLIHATPISHVGYAFSRFVAGLAALTAILAAWLVVQVALYELVPLDPNEQVRGPFVLWHYLQPLLVVVLPAVVFVGGVSAWLGVRTRQPVLVFALPVVLVVGSLFFVWNFNPMWLPSWIDELLKLADPAGLRWVLRNFVEEDRGVAFYNTAAFTPDAPFLASRVGFVAVGLLAVWATGRQLARNGHDDLRVGDPAALLAQAAAEAARRGPDAPAAIAARGALPACAVRAPGLLASTWHVLAAETRALLRSPGIWLFGPIILLQAWGSLSFREGPFHTESLMTTGAAATSVFNTLTLLLCLLLLFYTVESLVREERCGLSAIFRAAPVPTAAVLAGKVLANAVLALVVVGCAALAIALVLLRQQATTGIAVGFELPVLVLLFGGLLTPTLILWAAFVALLQALLRNRFAVYGVALAALIGTGLATQFGALNWVTMWHLWGVLTWSELDRLAFMWPAIAANRLLVLALAAFFVVTTLALWPRRTPDLRSVADRVRPRTLLRALARPALAAVPVLALAIHAGLQVRAGYEGAPVREAEKAYWRRNAQTFEDAPSPALDKVDGEIKLYPETRSLAVAATYVLRNPHTRPMAELPLTVGAHLTASNWQVDGVAVDPELRDQPAPTVENRSRLYVVRPARPLARDETVTVRFELAGAYPRGWSRITSGTGEFLLPSGVVLTSFGSSFLPVVGFGEGVGVDEDNRRDAREYPADHWRERVDPLFGPAWATDVRLAVEGPADWTINVVGVEQESTVVDGRRRTVWQTEHPVRIFNIVGGPLLAKDGDGARVFYSPRTPHNVDTMVKALAAARRRYSGWYGDYPWTNLRVTQFPGLAGYAQGFPGNISFAEGIGYLAKPIAGDDEEDADDNRLDVAFYIVAHESGHQWWGNIVTPGKGPGGNIVSEGLAEFSALMLVHHELGDQQGAAVRRRWERRYTYARSADDERPIHRTDGSRPGDQSVTYERAGSVFWMLRELMGEDAMLAGLRDFVAKWRNGVATPDGLDFPLIEDLVESLRARAPEAAAFDAFVGAWIFGTKFPDLEVVDLKTAAGDVEGAHVVTGALRDIATGRSRNGLPVDVVVRVLGAKPDGGGPAPHADVVVRVAGEGGTAFRVPTPFAPVQLVVDPDARRLFAGRTRCAKSL